MSYRHIHHGLGLPGSKRRIKRREERRTRRAESKHRVAERKAELAAQRQPAPSEAGDAMTPPPPPPPPPPGGSTGSVGWVLPLVGVATLGGLSLAAFFIIKKKRARKKGAAS